MGPSHYQLLANCTDERLRQICERRKLPLPQFWQEGPEGRMRLLKTMVFHLEDNKHLTNTLLDLGSQDGTYINGRLIKNQQSPLNPGDALRLGGILLVFDPA